MTDKIIEGMAWEAYCSHCATDPIDPNKQPSRREFKVQAVVWLAVAQAALKAIQDSGYAVVPVEPSDEMINAARSKLGHKTGVSVHYPDPRHVRHALLVAIAAGGKTMIQAAQKEE